MDTHRHKKGSVSPDWSEWNNTVTCFEGFNVSRKKEQRARQKLLSTPWWKVKDNWYFISIFLLVAVIILLSALWQFGVFEWTSKAIIAPCQVTAVFLTLPRVGWCSALKISDVRLSVRVDIVIIYQSIFPFFIWIVEAKKNRRRPIFLVDLSYWFREYLRSRRFYYG